MNGISSRVRRRRSGPLRFRKGRSSPIKRYTNTSARGPTLRRAIGAGAFHIALPRPPSPKELRLRTRGPPPSSSHVEGVMNMNSFLLFRLVSPTPASDPPRAARMRSASRPAARRLRRKPRLSNSPLALALLAARTAPGPAAPEGGEPRPGASPRAPAGRSGVARLAVSHPKARQHFVEYRPSPARPLRKFSALRASDPCRRFALWPLKSPFSSGGAACLDTSARRIRRRS